MGMHDLFGVVDDPVTEAACGPRVLTQKVRRLNAALSRQVACTDGLCSSAPKKGDE